MNFFKKAAAVAAAAAMAAGMSSVSLFAEDTYKLHVDSESASVGESVEVKVIIDTGSTGVGAIAFKLSYDPEELELVSAKPGEELKGWITGDVDSEGNSSFNLSTPGTIGFGYVAMSSGFSEKSVTLINAAFNVLKPNARFTLSEVVIGADDMDATDITDQGSFEAGTVVKCSHKNTDEKVTEATCKDEGRREVTCKDCGETVASETIPKTNEHAWDDGTVTTQPTCTEKGVRTFTCTVCGETKTEETEAAGHSWDQGAITTEPTCTEKGVRTFTCANCGETKTEEIASLEHSWDQGEVTAEPTCTEKGVRTFTCANCGETKTEEIAALGHDWDEWTVTKEATADNEGEETRQCKNCGEKETRAIAKLPAETTPFHIGEGFIAPVTTSAASESAETTTAAVTEQSAGTAETTAAAAEVTSASSDNTTENTEAGVSDTYGTTDTVNIGNAEDLGSTSSGNAEGKNVPTGIILSVIPAAIGAAGVILFKKRK